ncbi:hypothetical protein HPG69_017564 [Diceros bicornis minor]|uniref:Uncharacterized protein n=1 Tax=Diceros bicornis minor TaxID=77932 RepID=A0A7J7EKM0_DICBM|nr:hypothetical protein HPG69_017564 [Diceros bicornis minor]
MKPYPPIRAATDLAAGAAGNPREDPSPPPQYLLQTFPHILGLLLDSGFTTLLVTVAGETKPIRDEGSRMASAARMGNWAVICRTQAAGSFTSAFAALVLSPTELVKCWLQTRIKWRRWER